MFTYREVPQESTGPSPFALYGRSVRGPLDILKECWETPTKSSENIISYVLDMREKLEEMSELVRENLQKSQVKQKTWYNRKAREQSFDKGDKVLVLLLSSTHELSAEWQGPYPIERKVGEVDYEVNMGDRRKKLQVFHVNMLRRSYAAVNTSYLVGCVQEQEEVGEIPVLEVDSDDIVTTGDPLSEAQKKELLDLLVSFSDVIMDKPGRTKEIEHTIVTNDTTPVRQIPYQLPYSQYNTVKMELEQMESMGIIRPSTSEWASPIVIVPKKDGTYVLIIGS